MNWQEKFKKSFPWTYKEDDDHDIENFIQSLLDQRSQEIISTLKKLNRRSQKDAYHCNCLPHAIWVIEGEDEEAKEILKELEKEQEVIDTILSELKGGK